MGLFDDKLKDGAEGALLPPGMGQAAPATEDARLLDDLRTAEWLVNQWAWRSIFDDTCVEEEWEGCDLSLRKRARKFEIMAAFMKRGRFGVDRVDDALDRFEAMDPLTGLEKVVVAALRTYLAVDSTDPERFAMWSRWAEYTLSLTAYHDPEFGGAFRDLCAELWGQINREGSIDAGMDLGLGDRVLFAFLEMPSGFAIDPSCRPQVIAIAPAAPSLEVETAAPAGSVEAMRARLLERLKIVYDDSQTFFGDPDTDELIRERAQSSEAAMRVIRAMPGNAPAAEWLGAAFAKVAPLLPGADQRSPTAFMRRLVDDTFASLAAEIGAPSPVVWPAARR